MELRMFTLFAVLSLSLAMVPLRKRALISDETELASITSTSTAKPSYICAVQTPCKWGTYKNQLKTIDVIIPNTYCVCSPDTMCVVDEEDSSRKVFTFRCRERSPENLNAYNPNLDEES